MDMVNLGESGLMVSRLCLGAMTFGGQLDENASIKVLCHALDAGINFIDTADVYTEGASERIVGHALAGRRDQVVLASKVGGRTAPGPTGQGLARAHVLDAIDCTLERLGTDYLDVYYMHFPDLSTPLEETLEVMNELVVAGKVRAVGMSNHPAWKMADARRICEQNGYAAPVVTESRLNLLTRAIELEVAPYAMHSGMALTAYNPLAGGLLTGKHTRSRVADDSRFSDRGGYYRRYWNDTNFDAMDRMATIAEEAGMTLIELALRWCVSRPYVTSTILGASKLEHLESNLQAIGNGTLSRDLCERCDEVWKKASDNKLQYTD